MRSHTDLTNADGDALLEFPPERSRGPSVDEAHGRTLPVHPPRAAAALLVREAMPCTPLEPRSGDERSRLGRSQRPHFLPGRVVRDAKGPIALFAVGSLFGALVMWLMSSGASQTIPVSQPAAAAPTFASSPVRMDEAAERATSEAPTRPARVSIGPPAVTLVEHRKSAPQLNRVAPNSVPVVSNPPRARSTNAQRRRTAGELGIPAAQSPSSERRARVTAPLAPVEVPRFRGSLAIHSTPVGARVLINRQPVGRTPIVLTDVPVGSRAIRVEADGHQPWAAVIRVVADQETRVDATLSLAD